MNLNILLRFEQRLWNMHVY